MAFQDYFELYFTTATIKDWKWLLKPDKYKEIITDSFAYLVTIRYRNWHLAKQAADYCFS